jgi:hypothetical protein
MITSRIEGEEFIGLDQEVYRSQVRQLVEPAIANVIKISKRYVLFNISFLILFFAEVALFLLFLADFAQSTLLALTLASTFLTGFTYFILRIYYLARKPEQFIQLCNEHGRACREAIQYQEGIPEHHLALANALCTLSAGLRNREYRCYSLPKWMGSLQSVVDKFSCWWHWRDIFQVREVLLKRAIEEQINYVKSDPISLEAHAALANTYVLLAGLYYDPALLEANDEEYWIPPQRISEEIYHEFRYAAERAVEELKILSGYAPEDPWVHVQLAYNYHDLHMPDEEIKEYEIVLLLTPDDQEVLFRLGMLYFQQGRNGPGLQVYEELRRTHFSRAEELIRFYGSYDPAD